jgi:phenylacetate-CoA ligase
MTGIKMALYPTILRNLLMPTYEKIKGKNLLHYINEYESHLSWSSEQLKAYQWQQVSKLIRHAYNTTGYYKRVWNEAGIKSPDDITSMSDFYKLPLTTKDDIKAHYDQFISSAFNNNIKKSTGGSTGQPFHFELNTESNTRREAVMWRGYGWLGAGLGQKTLYLWGADIGKKSFFKTIKNDLYHSFYNRKMMNSFAMNQHNMQNYVDDVNQFKPSALVSYVNPLFQLANYIIEHKLSVYSPKSILTGAEPLYPHQREVIEKAFNSSIYDTFGCREFMLMSAECQQNKNLHINSDHLVVETINSVSESVQGQTGDLVITDLFNYGMPLIRYVNGDRATLVDEPCSCGNPLPIMKSVDGRKLDIIKTPSGKSIPGELFPHLFKEFTSIYKFQIKQSVINELLIQIVPNGKFSENDKANIITEINKYAENELTLNFKIVDEIPLTVSGKHRVTVCEVK